MFKVIKFFTDLQDHNHAYRVGDIFPRKGLKVSEDRLIELSTSQNKRGIPLIEAVEGEAPVKEAEVIEAVAPEKKAEEAEIAVEEEKPEEIVADEVEKPKKGRKSTKKTS